MADQEEPPNPNQQPPTDAPPGNAVPPAPPVTTTAPPGQSPAGGGGTSSDGEGGKVIPVKHSDFAKIKDEAKEKGRREALTEMDAMASELGFDSLKGALKQLADLKKKPAEPAITPKPPETTTMTTPAPKKKPAEERAAEKAARESQRLADERTKLRKDYRSSQRQIRELKRSNDAKDAQMQLERQLMQAGVKELDYVSRMVVNALAGKSVEEVKAFDIPAFCKTLKEKQPFLFGETVVPLTTGTNGTKPDGTQPAAPAPSTTVPAAAGTQQFDARTATREQLDAHLKKLGLNANHS